MEIKIGTKFEKKVGNSKNACHVVDIIECTYLSTATGKTTTNTIYLAKSDTYGMGQSFEVAKNTILRSLINSK